MTNDPSELELGWTAVLLLALAHAALFFASFHPLALFPLAWIAFAPFAVIVERARTTGMALAGGFLAFACGGGAAVVWLRLFGPEPWLATAFGFGLYGLFMVGVGRPMARGLGLPAVLWLPVAVCAQEFLRGHLFFWAFPWVYLGHSQIAIGPLVQSADLGGALLISFVVAAFSGGLADLALRRRGALRLAGVVAAALVLCGYGALRERSIEVVGGGPRALIVQANIPQDMKEGSGLTIETMLKMQYDLTMKSIDAARGRGEPVDLVVWPETMVLPTKWRGSYARANRPWPFDPILPYASLDVDPDLRDWFKNIGGYSHGARSIVGSLHAEDRAGELVEHNSAFYLAADGRVLGRYDKMFPAPMSEYTPFYRSWPALYRFLRETFVPPGFSQFEPGADVPIWELDGWKLGASVCFDITFPAASNRAARNGADVIVNVSNYGWFKDSAELDLARVQTIFRAVETRRGVVACCNGGISSLVDPRGRAEDIVGRDERTGAPSKKQVAGTLLRPLVTSRAFSLFAFAGDWVGAASTAAALALAALGAARARRRRAEKGSEEGAA